MDSKKKKEIEKRLTDLTVIELRRFAKDHSIDISGTVRKKELIDKILDWEKAHKIGTLLIAGGGDEEEEEELEEDLEAEIPEQEMAGAEPKATGKSKQEKRLDEIREYIRLVEGNRPTFFGIDGMLEGALARYAARDYYGAIQSIKGVREKASDIYSHFRIFTNAIGIDASEKLLEEAVKKKTISQTQVDKLIRTALLGFVDGSPKTREETLIQLENEATSAFDKIVGNISENIELLKRRSNEMNEIGADVIEASRLLGEAENLKAVMKLQEAKERLEKVHELLRQAEKVRLEEIKFSIPRVRAAIEEAKSIGLDIKEPEKDLKKAGYYLERGEIRLCVESLSRSESVVDQMQSERLSADPALRKSQLDKAQAIAQQQSTIIADLTSYGIDTSEVMHYLRNTQVAISRNDSINAPKFVRRVEDLTKLLSNELEKLKKRSVHISGERCERCGQEMLYKYDTGIRRCSNCGHYLKQPPKEPENNT